MLSELLNGAQGRNRTTDTVIFSHVLYQLSYLGVRGHLACGFGPASFPNRHTAGIGRPLFYSDVNRNANLSIGGSTCVVRAGL